jgi:hypothetical protein
MSQETQIGNLGGGISEEDSRLVDSILNDINSGSQQGQPQQGQPQQGQPQQGQHQQGHPQQGHPQQGQQGQPSPEQIRMMQQQQQQQMAMRQQQMAQQQQIAQQQMTQQQMEQKQNMIKSEGSNDIVENIKIEAKNVMVVIFLCIFFNVDQVDNLFKSQGMFLNEAGSLNMQAVFIKAVIIGIIFYVAKTYLL